MMYDSDEALDRALFALPLEEPPSDLRSAILTATVYRPAPAFGVWEIAALGALAGVLLWLIVSLAMGGGAPFLQSAATVGSAVLHGLSNVAVLTWLAAGVATAFWLTFFIGAHPVAAAPSGQRSNP